jgi:uncharacterized protein
MREKSADPRRLELGAFSRNGGRIAGESSQSGLGRLAESTLAVPGDTAPPPVAWRAQGEQRPVVGGEPEVWLHLQAQTSVTLQCQRCLQPMTEPLVVDRRLQFVRGEETAAQLDEDSEHDVLALPPRLDLIALLEDELILALPIVPRHGVCPQPLAVPAGAPAAAEDEPAHPFAALASLRGPTGA